MHPTAFFILGHAGTGKSFLTSHFIRRELARGRGWCVLDKDAVSEAWSGPFLQALGHDPNDRDSPAFKQHIRDLGYLSTLRIARDQLELGLSVMLPGPWSRELASEAIFSPQALGLPADTRLRHVWLELDPGIRKDRIVRRADPRDRWKLDHWDSYIDKLRAPAAVQSGRIPTLDAGLPLNDQLRILQSLTASA